MVDNDGAHHIGLQLFLDMKVPAQQVWHIGAMDMATNDGGLGPSVEQTSDPLSLLLSLQL